MSFYSLIALLLIEFADGADDTVPMSHPLLSAQLDEFVKRAYVSFLELVSKLTYDNYVALAFIVYFLVMRYNERQVFQDSYHKQPMVRQIDESTPRAMESGNADDALSVSTISFQTSHYAISPMPPLEDASAKEKIFRSFLNRSVRRGVRDKSNNIILKVLRNKNDIFITIEDTKRKVFSWFPGSSKRFHKWKLQHVIIDKGQPTDPSTYLLKVRDSGDKLVVVPFSVKDENEREWLMFNMHILSDKYEKAKSELLEAVKNITAAKITALTPSSSASNLLG